jgi:hypothetical protein
MTFQNMGSYLTRVCLTNARQENERRTLRVSGRHDRLSGFTTAIVKGHGMPQATACFAIEEDVSEIEGGHAEPSRRVRESETTSLMHLRKLRAALRRVDSHVRTTAVQEPAQRQSPSEHCCTSHQPALPRIPTRLTPFGQCSGTNAVGYLALESAGSPRF